MQDSSEDVPQPLVTKLGQAAVAAFAKAYEQNSARTGSERCSFAGIGRGHCARLITSASQPPSYICETCIESYSYALGVLRERSSE